MQYRKEEAFQGCTDEEIISIIKEAYKNLLKICFRVNAEKTTWGLKEKDLIQLFVDEQGETLWQEEKDAFAELLGDKTIKEKHSQELIKIASGDLVKCSLPLWCVTSMWESVWERLWEQINKNNSHDRSE